MLVSVVLVPLIVRAWAYRVIIFRTSVCSICKQLTDLHNIYREQRNMLSGFFVISSLFIVTAIVRTSEL
jgi:hypothetical protein